MMADTGLVQGTIAPESTEDFSHVVEQALAAVKRYASSAMLASAVAPRGTSPSSPTGRPMGRIGAGHPGVAVRGETSFDPRPDASFGGLGDSEQTGVIDPDADSHKLHACRNCQKAKTACTDHRPCARCLRL